MAGASCGVAAQKKKRKGLQSIETWPVNRYWKEAGCSEDSSTLVGRMKVNAKLVTKEEGTEKHRLHHCPEWYEVRRRDSKEPTESGNKKRKLQRKSGSGKGGIVEHPPCEKPMERGVTSGWKSGSLRSTKVGHSSRRFQGHVATDGSLLDIAGKWEACG